VNNSKDRREKTSLQSNALTQIPNPLSERANDLARQKMSLEILRIKFEEAKSYNTISVTAFTIYLAINGVLLKYAFEKDIAPSLPIVLSIIGVATSTLYIAVALFKNLVRQQLEKDVAHLNESLGCPLVAKQLTGLRYISVGTGSFSVFALVGWFVLLLRFTRNWWDLR